MCSLIRRVAILAGVVVEEQPPNNMSPPCHTSSRWIESSLRWSIGKGQHKIDVGTGGAHGTFRFSVPIEIDIPTSVPRLGPREQYFNFHPRHSTASSSSGAHGSQVSCNQVESAGRVAC